MKTCGTMSHWKFTIVYITVSIAYLGLFKLMQAKLRLVYKFQYLYHIYWYQEYIHFFKNLVCPVIIKYDVLQTKSWRGPDLSIQSCVSLKLNKR